LRNLFRFVGLRHLQRKSLRTVLATAGICLGVALFVAIQVINRSTRNSFKENFEAVAGKSSLVVSAGEAGFAEDRVEIIARVPGVRHAVPMVLSRGFFAGANGGGDTVRVFGIDLLKEQAVRTYKTSDEHIIEDPLVFLNQPDSIILTNALARKRGLTLGGHFELETARGIRRFTVRGLLSPEGPAKAFGGAMAIMDIDGARFAFGKEGHLDRVDVVLVEGESVDVVTARLKAALGPGYQVEPPAGQAEGLAHMVESYQTMMTFFSSLALLVGLFLVATAVSISVAERKREIGTLRALGAGRPAILALFVSEAGALGAVGGFLGAWVGRGLAVLMLPGAVESLSGQAVTKIDVARLQFGMADVGQAVVIGAVTSLLAALWPAISATRVQPIEAMRRWDVDERTAGNGILRFAFPIGSALLLYLGLSSVMGWGARSVALDNLNQLSAILGSALMGPAIVLGLVRLLRRAGTRFAWTATVLRLAEDNLLRNPRRTAVNVVTIMIGLILVIFMTSVSESFSRTMVDWVGRGFHADLFVCSEGSMISIDVQPLHEEVGAALAKVPGIQMSEGRGVFGVRFIHLTYQGQRVAMKAWDEPRAATNYEVFDVIDRPAADAGRDLFRDPSSMASSTASPTAMVSENFALHFGKKTGDTLELETPSGLLRAKIVGVVVDFGSSTGVIYLGRPLYKKYWADPLVNGFGLDLSPGVDVETVRADIERAVGKDMHLVIASTAELKTELKATIQKGFSDARSIELAALLVGLMGLLNTLLVSVLERTRELGMLRAIGMSRAQMMRMVLAEALLQGAFAAVVSVVFGTWIASLWIKNSLSHVLGWTVHFHFPLSAVSGTFFIGLLVAWLAGIYPSWRAARIPIREALGNE
jgi:putative ABC transport system permease protein